MVKKFIAELHDIGKLVDKNKLDKFKGAFNGHTFEDFDFAMHNIPKPTSPSWWGQYHHKIKSDKEINEWPDIDIQYRCDIFFLIIADHLASSISRALPQLGSAGESEGVLKLWNEKFYENEKSNGKYWAAFTTDDALEELFETVDNCLSPDEFLSKYRENLLLTPEDKSIPRNITSLYTHVELVGKIYRILKKHCKVKNDEKGTFLELNEKPARNIKKAEGGNRTSGNQASEKGQWQARFIKCWIKFPHSFVRLQDMSFLAIRQELCKKFIARNKDYVMFHTQDFLSLFLPMEMNANEMFSGFLENGFRIEMVETIADLGILRSNLDRKLLMARKDNDASRLSVLTARETKVYRRVLIPDSLPAEIDPPICDICQIQPAKERVKENIKEWICDKCYEIRESGESFNYPEEWQDSKVIWFKFKLDQNKLEEWLQKAFEKHIDGLSDLRNKETLKEEFRSLACQCDFVNDYLAMVNKFWCVCEGLQIEKPISGQDEIGVCKYSGEAVKFIVKKFVELHSDYFPDCDGDQDSPISLTLSISPIKYPLREHFRYFENPKGFLNIRNHNVFEETYAKEEIKWLIKELSEAKTESLHFLYKLIGLYDGLNSEVNITVEILNNKDKHPGIFSLYSKFETSPKKILNFFRIVEETDEITKT